MAAGGWRARDALVVAAAVVALSLVPLLVNPSFYFWDDTAAAYVPAWSRITEALRAGGLPGLQVDMWRGGNLPGDAQYGVYNPVVWVLAWVSGLFDDLNLAAWAFKVPFLVALGLGVAALAVELGATRRPAVLAGVAAPIMGFAFWFDATSWPMSLIITATLPWLNVLVLRLRHGTGLLPLALLTWLLLILGTPYGAVAAGLVYACWLVWLVAVRELAAAARIALVGVGCALAAAAPYLAFAGTVGVGVRTQAVGNDEFLRPGIGDLLNLSSPGYFPAVAIFAGDGRFDLPAAYLAWFVVPLGLWFGWRRWSTSLRRVAPLLLQAGVLTALVLAPSHLWFFRWPWRNLPWLFVLVLALWAVVATAWDRSGRPIGARQPLLMGGVVVASAWLAFGEAPEQRWAIVALTGVWALACLVAWWVAGSSAPTSSRLWVVVGAGSAVVFAVQLVHVPANPEVAAYDVPTSRRALAEQFAWPGTVVQVVSQSADAPPGAYRADGGHQYFLPGSLPSLAGRSGPNAYGATGFRALDDQLCMGYNGYTCPEALDALFRAVDDRGTTLADAMRVDRVVVATWDLDGRRLPEGWTETMRNAYVVQFDRVEPRHPVPGTLSVVPDGWRAETTAWDQRSERVEVTATGQPGSLVFARLAWPGYRAVWEDAEGSRAAPVDATAEGLLRVTLPQGAGRGAVVVAWDPPGWDLAPVLLGAGLLLLLAARPWRPIGSASRALDRLRAPDEPEPQLHPAGVV
ncbi:MAG: hypothetical protein MUF35_03505 [Candidatus Nanopelagicales bacterium]|jgi:hypothetical protein|nr:hypothetical protein [Candidatus Nanopelagicales bacterium]